MKQILFSQPYGVHWLSPLAEEVHPNKQLMEQPILCRHRRIALRRLPTAWS